MNNESRNTKSRRGSGLWSALAYFGLVAAVVAGIYIIGVPEADTEPTVQNVTVEATTTTTSSPEVVVVEAPTYVPGDEPIADAAEIILPSVVHIETAAGLGSGVVWDSSGLIITAAHVVEGNDTVIVRFDDGDQASARVLGTVSDVDVAVLQVDRDDLVPAVFTTHLHLSRSWS